MRDLREKAFSALQGYANTLVSLASEEPTEAITLELTGLVDDISNTLEAAKQIKATSDVVSKIAQVSGPLEKYVSVLNEIIRQASKFFRERAIVRTIVESNDTILALLLVLKTEATTAQGEAAYAMSSAQKRLDTFRKGKTFDRFSNDTRAWVVQQVAELATIERRIKDTTIAEAFDSALKAQSALVEKGNGSRFRGLGGTNSKFQREGVIN